MVLYIYYSFENYSRLALAYHNLLFLLLGDVIVLGF